MYAITDEVHQIYVPGRSGGRKDILIDSLGILTGIGVVLLIKKIIKSKLKEG
jgi:VanZ family protein